MALQHLKKYLKSVENMFRLTQLRGPTFCNTSAYKKSLSFRQLPPSVVTPKFKNRLACRKHTPGSENGGFPEFLAPPRIHLPHALRPETGERYYSTNEWAQMCQEQLDIYLPSHGVVLIRGVPIGSADEFGQLTKNLRYKPTSYKGGTGYRSKAGSHQSIYVSTDDPPSCNMELHNEMAYSPVYPRKVIFFCLHEPKENCGGLTPIARNDEILAKLDRKVVEKLKKKNIRYLRYLPSQTKTSYASWQRSFQTDNLRLVMVIRCVDTCLLNIEKVEEFLESQEFNYKWDKETGALTYWYTLPAFMKHPETGEDLWFNQSTAHHCTFFTELPMYQGVHMAEDKYPTHTTYGDGSAIEPEVLQHIRATGWQCAVGFQWKTGDLLFLDNLRVQHGKLSSTSERKILAYLTED